MGNYTIFQMFENPRRGRQARNCTTNVSKIVDLKSSELSVTILDQPPFPELFHPHVLFSLTFHYDSKIKVVKGGIVG